MSEWTHHNKRQQTSLKKCLFLPNACSWNTVHFLEKKKKKKDVLTKIIPFRYKSWPLLFQWLSLWRTVFILASICLPSISYLLILLGVWLIEKMVLHSNLHATPHCSSPSGPGSTWGLSLNPLHISAPSWTMGPVVGNIAAGSVSGLRVLNTAQPSLLMTTTSHCAFFSVRGSLNYKTTFNERAMEMYIVFLHPSSTK